MDILRVVTYIIEFPEEECKIFVFYLDPDITNNPELTNKVFGSNEFVKSVSACRSKLCGDVEEKELGNLEREPGNAPRKAAVDQFRLLTGHVSPISHYYRIGITDSSNCVLRVTLVIM
ncbi:hypothetical protein TNCV_1389241 [Trichonephila clavipes]|nr:hypothetical protein TNCV_1389241 [Trichonephila clavipes]